MITDLHQPPAEERGDEERKRVKRQTGDLRVRAVPPVVGKQVDAASTLGREHRELAVEELGVRLR